MLCSYSALSINKNIGSKVASDSEDESMACENWPRDGGPVGSIIDNVFGNVALGGTSQADWAKFSDTEFKHLLVQPPSRTPQSWP